VNPGQAVTLTLIAVCRRVCEKTCANSATHPAFVENAKGTFPISVKLSAGSTRWRLADIEEWEATLQIGQVSDLSDLPDSIWHRSAA
jgi:predicted DNA-binding transcriptional regulator AlpA